MIERGAIKSGRPLASLAQEAIRYMAETALKKPFRFDMEFQKGDIQLLNNYCILHSRETYEDWPEPERRRRLLRLRSEAHTSELQSLMRISYAVFCLKKKK